MKTNLQELGELEFKDKEDKWFSQIQGVTTELSNVDTKEFSVQGIDNASSISYPPISGCMDSTTIDGCGLGCNGALNYNPNATISDDSCIYCIYGCMTGSLTYPQINVNFDPLATCDDGCVPCIYGCMTLGQSNYNSLATCDDGSCIQCVYGCMNQEACNYNPLATCDDGSCNTVWGCTNPLACNYDSPATGIDVVFPV